MRKFITILLILISFVAKAQTIQFLGSPGTQIYVRGQLRVDTVVYLPLTDTAFRPTQKGAVVFKSSNNLLYIWDGLKWNSIPVGSTAWGQITGSIASQTDLISYLAGNYQPLTTFGYGLKAVGNTVTYDSATIRKVDSIYRLNDSTVQYILNGRSYTVLVRGTAAGGINSLVYNASSQLYDSAVVFTNSGGAWSGTPSLAVQNANFIFSGPTTGSPARPTFRALNSADIPAGIPNSKLQNSIINFSLGSSGTAPTWAGAVVPLGATATLNLPTASSTNSGILSNTDWSNFNTKVSNLGNATAIKAGPFLSRPVAGNLGLLYASTDSLKWSYDNGTSWIDLGGAGSGAGVVSFNTRTGAVTLTSGDVVTALGYAPLSSTDTGYTHLLATPEMAAKKIDSILAFLTPAINIKVTNAGNLPNWQAGTLGSRPSAGSYTGGYISTTDSVVYYSDGSTWIPVGRISSATADSGVLVTAPLRRSTSGPRTIFGDSILNKYRSDLGPLSLIKISSPAQGIASSNNVTNYTAPTLDSVFYPYSTVGVGAEHGGWISPNATGDSVEVTTPFWIVFGDSQAEGHPGRHGRLHPNASVFQYNYPDSDGQISYFMRGLTHMRWYNQGIGGQTTPQMRLRWDRDVLGLAVAGSTDGLGNQTLSRRPQGVVIIGGINDPFNSVSVATTEANLEYFASSCQQYGIRCVILNLPGDAISGLSQLQAIQSINNWLASGVMDQYGACVVDYNTWWNDPTYNDNIHHTALIVDDIHPSLAGYDSLATYIFNKAKLPVLDSMFIFNPIAPTNPVTNLAEPASATIGGVTYTIPSNDKVAIAAYIGGNNGYPTGTSSGDTLWIKVLTARTLAGAGTNTGLSTIRWFTENYPLPDSSFLYTHRTLFSGSQKADLSLRSVAIIAGNNNALTPIDVQMSTASNNHAFQLNVSGGGASAILNGLANTTAINSATMSVYHSSGVGFGTDGSYYGTGGTNQFGNMQILNNAFATATGYGISVGNGTESYMRFMANNGTGPDAFRWTLWTGTTRNIDAVINSINNNFHFLAGWGNFGNTGQTANTILIDPTYNNTGAFSGLFRGIYYNPTITSLGGSTEHRAMELAKGNIILGNTTAASRVSINSTTDDGSGSILQVNGKISALADSTNNPNGGFVYRDGTTGALKISASPAVAGTYTPTLTNTTNIAASSNNSAFYQRVGNIVHVTISVTLAPTSGLSACVLTFSLPITSSTSSGAGTGNWWTNGSGTPSAAMTPGQVTIASTTTGTFTFYNNTAFTSSQPAIFSFDYTL